MNNGTSKNTDIMNIISLLNEASDSKFVTRKWSILNGQSSSNYDIGSQII